MRVNSREQADEGRAPDRGGRSRRVSLLVSDFPIRCKRRDRHGRHEQSCATCTNARLKKNNYPVRLVRLELKQRRGPDQSRESDERNVRVRTHVITRARVQLYNGHTTEAWRQKRVATREKTASSGKTAPALCRSSHANNKTRITD